MADLIDLETAATKPWTVADGGTLWIASGSYRDGGGFEDCLIRCLPQWVHGTDGRLFEVLLYGETKLIGPADITRAREVLLVYAEDPLTAVDEDDQNTLDYALRDRGVV
jgi:hypothetical protein